MSALWLPPCSPPDALPDDLEGCCAPASCCRPPEHPGRALQLGFALLLRVEQVLQLHVQRLGAGGAQLCGAKAPECPARGRTIAAGQPGGDQAPHQLLGSVAIRFEEEIIRFAALLQLAADDTWWAFSTMGCVWLPEDLVEADGGTHRERDDLTPSRLPGPALQLVGASPTIMMRQL